MDEFAERMCAAPKHWADVPAVLSADDALLSAKTPTALQGLLDIVTYWAEERGMIWNTKRGKSEILLLDDTENHSFHLVGNALSIVPEVTYLGISLSQVGASDTRELGELQRTSRDIASMIRAGTKCIGIAIYCNMQFQSCIGVASKIA